MTQLARYTGDLYRGLEAETGQATAIANAVPCHSPPRPARMEELKRNASMAKVFGLAVDVVGPQEIHSLYRSQSRRMSIGGIHIPSDGYANAVDITQALRQRDSQRER